MGPISLMAVANKLDILRPQAKNDVLVLWGTGWP